MSAWPCSWAGEELAAVLPGSAGTRVERGMAREVQALNIWTKLPSLLSCVCAEMQVCTVSGKLMRQPHCTEGEDYHL
jgi:hypothetical protein